MVTSTTDKAGNTKRKVRRVLLLLVLVPFLLFTLYTGFALTYSYSEGERAGILQKFSRKGWVCKTFEGELAMTTVPGVAPVLWKFSVRDDAVARRVEAAVGKSVTIHYSEHRGVPTNCFGETPYFADSITVAP